MRSGVIEITPTAAGPLAGYAARGSAVSVGTQDPLEAALLVLDDGATRVGWLAIDAVAVPTALAEQLLTAVRAGLGDPGLHLTVSASHTHSAPVGWVGSIHPGHIGSVDPAAVTELVTRVTTLAAELAGRPAEPVIANWSHHRAIGLGANRLDPSGPHDDRVGVEMPAVAVDDGGVAPPPEMGQAVRVGGVRGGLDPRRHPPDGVRAGEPPLVGRLARGDPAGAPGDRRRHERCLGGGRDGANGALPAGRRGGCQRTLHPARLRRR